MTDWIKRALTRKIRHKGQRDLVMVVEPNEKLVLLFADAFASYPGQFRWNTNVDLDCNHVIDIKDAVMIAKNFGKTL